MKNTYLVFGKTRIAQLDDLHEFVKNLNLGSAHAPDWVPTSRDIVQLPMTFTIEVGANSVSEAEKVAHNSLDPIFEFDVHEVRRV